MGWGQKASLVCEDSPRCSCCGGRVDSALASHLLLVSGVPDARAGGSEAMGKCSYKHRLWSQNCGQILTLGVGGIGQVAECLLSIHQASVVCIIWTALSMTQCH
jgi:hypothetical protein